jgi:hypothetical protein
VTSALHDSITRIARHEANARAIAGVGRVTQVFDGSRQDHAVTVEMRDTGQALPQVPVAVGVMGFAAIPAVDDLVVVAFLEGDVNAPVVIGRLYHPDQAPPAHAEGQIVLNLPPTDPQLELLIEGAEPLIKLAMGDVELEVLSDSVKLTVGEVVIEALSSGNRVEVAAGSSSLVLKSSGEVTLKTDGDLKVQATNIELKAAATMKLSGAQVEIN